MATPGESNDKITAALGRRRAAVGGHGIPGRVLRARRPGHRHPGAGERLDVRADPALEGARAQRDAGVQPRAGLPLRRHQAACGSSTSRTCAPSSQFLTSDEGKAELKDLGGLSSATAGVILRELIDLRGPGRRRCSSAMPEFDTADLLRIAPDGRGIVSMLELPGVQDRPAAVLDLPDVAARRPLPRPARGRRPRQAQARVLLRRGAPALQRTRRKELPRRDPADRAADPLQGRRRLLRDPDAQGRAGRRARPARQPGAARAARLHPGRREGAQGGGVAPTPTPPTTSRSCSPSSAPARRSSPCCPRRVRRPRSPGPGCAPRSR